MHPCHHEPAWGRQTSCPEENKEAFDHLLKTDTFRKYQGRVSSISQDPWNSHWSPLKATREIFWMRLPWGHSQWAHAVYTKGPVQPVQGTPFYHHRQGTGRENGFYPRGAMVSRNWERNEEAGSNEGTFPPGCLLLGKTFRNTLEVSLASFQTRSFPSQSKIFPFFPK